MPRLRPAAQCGGCSGLPAPAETSTGLAASNLPGDGEGLIGAHLIPPDREDEKSQFGTFGGIRQVIESVFDTVRGHFGLKSHGARTIASVYAKTEAKLLALSAAIWHVQLIGASRRWRLIV